MSNALKGRIVKCSQSSLLRDHTNWLKLVDRVYNNDLRPVLDLVSLFPIVTQFLCIETDYHHSYRTALTLPGAFLIHLAILGFMYWPLHIRGVKLCLLSCTNTFWLFLMSVVQYMCRYGKIPGEGSVQHESMVLQLKGGIVRIFDLGSTGIMIGLQTCFLLWVMRMAWSPKSDAIESTEAGKR